MRGMQSAEQALRLATAQPSRQFVCQTCRQSRMRQYHTSSSLGADDVPFWKRLKNTLLGSKEQEEKSLKEEELDRETAISDAGKRHRQTWTDAKGHIYEYAKKFDVSVNTDYLPASNWKDLERVGSEKWLKQKQDQGEKYKGYWDFNAIDKNTSQMGGAAWSRLVRHVAIEAVLLKKYGRSLDKLTKIKKNPNTAWTSHWTATDQAKFEFSQETGNVEIVFPKKGSEQIILDRLGSPLPEVIKNPDPTQPLKFRSLNLPVKDPMVRFAIASRIHQMTGKRIPDAAISNARNLQDLCEAYWKPNSHQKLSESIKIQKVKVNLPNVTWHDKKVRKVTKDKAFGRWKLIEEELERRGLPVYGNKTFV